MKVGIEGQAGVDPARVLVAPARVPNRRPSLAGKGGGLVLSVRADA